MSVHQSIKTAVVILNYNGRKYLKKFLPSLLKSAEGKDEVSIIVADNASTDDSIVLMKSEFPMVRLIELESNYGFAGGYNKALERIDATYYVLLNSDVEVTEDWLDPLTEYMDEHPDVAACQPKICAYHRKDYYEYAGACGGYIDRYGYPFCRGRVFGTVEQDHGQYDTVADVFWASGACLFIRRDDYFEAGGLDERFFAHMEEIDLCWRLKSRGRRIVCVPQSRVWHVGGGTLPAGNPRKTYLNYRNNLLMLYKNLPTKHLRVRMLVRKTMDGVSALQMLLKGDVKGVQSIWKAHRDFRRMRHQYSDVRTENLEKTKDEDVEQMYDGSLVWDYFIRRRQRFSELKWSYTSCGEK